MTSKLSAAAGAFRFGLELAALACWGVAGWRLADSTFSDAGFSGTAVRWICAAGLVAAAAVLWGTFRVPGDESASGRAPVAVPGWVRLGLELVVLAGAAVAVAAAGLLWYGVVLLSLVALHYLTTWSRVRWLLAR